MLVAEDVTLSKSVFPAIVAVTTHVWAEVLLNVNGALTEIEQPAVEVANVTAPLVVPPEVLSVKADPKVGEPDVMLIALWLPLFMVKVAFDEATKAVLLPTLFVTTTE